MCDWGGGPNELTNYVPTAQERRDDANAFIIKAGSFYVCDIGFRSTYWSCIRCGALVHEKYRVRHYSWHEEAGLV